MVTLQARVAAAESNSEHASGAARQILALNMIRLRGMRGLSQGALPLECGLHRTFIAHVERQARNISLDNIERIATALGVTVAELMASPRSRPLIARCRSNRSVLKAAPEDRHPLTAAVEEQFGAITDRAAPLLG